MRDQPFRLMTPDGVSLECVLFEPEDASQGTIPTVLLAHGITADLDESGAFLRLAQLLASNGMRTVRFSFRGHGKSSLASELMTCAGEAIDLRTMVDYCTTAYGQDLSIVAASFGTVSTSIMAHYLDQRVRAVCLWNPVVDIESTFLKPTLPWGIKNFSGGNLASLYDSGYFLIDGSFKVGVVFWEELQYLSSYDGLSRLTKPILLLHGDLDSYVPYSSALAFIKTHPNAVLTTIVGADHGFEIESHENQVLNETVAFLSSRT